MGRLQDGKPAEAIQLAKTALTAIDRIKRTANVDVPLIGVYTILSSAFRDSKNLVEAEKAQRILISLIEKSKDSSSRYWEQYTLNLIILAEIHADEGRNSEAEEGFRSAIQMREDHFGSRSTVTAEGLANLGDSYFDLQRFDDAEIVSKRALSIFGKEALRVGPKSEKSEQLNEAMIATTLNLARIDRAKGRYKDAEAKLTHNIGFIEMVYGKNTSANISNTIVGDIYFIISSKALVF